MFGLDGPDATAADSLGLIAGMAGSVAAFDEARAAAEGVELVYPPEEIRDVAICGMGGSAIAADLVVGAYRERLRVPVTVVRDYYLPGWIGENTLVILSSYSGGTEETLTCASQATERNSLCVAVTSGGKLGTFYAAEGVPVVPVVPGLQPRAAILRMLVPLIVLFDRLGVLPSLTSDLEEARATIATSVATLGPEVPESDNPAKQLARSLQASIPLVWGAELTAPVAQRWKGQFNENAKVPSFENRIPELTHNEICGWAQHGDVTRQVFSMVLLRHDHEHPRNSRRFELTAEICDEIVADVHTVTAEGDGAMAQLFDLILQGDFVTLELAAQSGVDPGPIPVLDGIKASMTATPR